MKDLLRGFSLCLTSFMALCAFSCPVTCVAAAPLPAAPPDQIIIPGPIRSFERMAGISQKVTPADVLPLLARNVYMNGYQQNRPTEFLLLIGRYLQQARELQILAGPEAVIKVTGCDDAGTLIHILGYRLRAGCGQKNFSLETANPDRAFLTIDSGFPLVDLEEVLQNGTPFVYAYPSARVPILFRATDWMGLTNGAKRTSGAMPDSLLSDPLVARLYWALAKQDTETRIALQRSPGLQALLPYAGVLDFYGSQIAIRSGKVAVPGGSAAQAEWKDLAGASPDAAGQFILALLAKDNGWLFAYFDTLSRVSSDQQKHLIQPPRLKRLYESFRSVDPNIGSTRGVFRRSPDLLVLFSRVQWDQGGEPRVPGGLEVWKEILTQKSNGKFMHDLGRHNGNWNTPEQLLETMTALSKIDTDIGPLQVFLTATEIDSKRQPDNRLSPATVRLLANRFPQFNKWYQVFAEFHDLNNESVARFINVADTVDKIANSTLRANTEGSFQATIGLWQILARQGQIPPARLNASWLKLMGSYNSIASPTQLFDASRASLSDLQTATGASGTLSQDSVVELLAGPRQQSPEAERVHAELSARIRAVLDDQRLVSLDTLFALSDGLRNMAQSGARNDSLLPLAAELREFDLPRPIFTNREKISWAPTIYVNHHAELQIQTDLTRVIQNPAAKAQLETARGQLAPFLRDTLVGLNYAYYEPPGAQMLHHNPLFVRSHDFLGVSVLGADRLWGTPSIFGAGSPAGGGAYLIGSLADLSYALASTEQDFIAPKNVQALIWKEVVPIMLVSATLPRWWTVTPNELHAAALYQASGEELLIASASDPELRRKVFEILSDRISPQRMEELERSQRPEDVVAVLPRIMPAETFYLAAEFYKRFPQESPSWGPASLKLRDLQTRYPEEVACDRVARDFGVPHPTLAQTNAPELLNMKPFPSFGSHSSRLFGESWESGNLYWARLADEMGYPPASLNSLVPELTRRTVANIFATELEDWPAVLRAMRETGEEFRQARVATAPRPVTSSLVSEQTAHDASSQ